MASKNCLVTRFVQVKITGISMNSKDDAVSQAFKNLQAEVSKEVEDLIVYMKPLEVSIEDLEVKEYTERFLFIFMPRKKQKVKITLSVKAEVASLAIN